MLERCIMKTGIISEKYEEIRKRRKEYDNHEFRIG